MYKDTWVRMVEGRVSNRELMDNVLLSKLMHGRLLVNVCTGESGGMFDHFLVEAK